MSRATLAALAVTLAVPVLVPAQTPKTESPPLVAASQPQATFKAGVELVRLDVRVVDGAGLPVKDLKANEVQVLEGDTQRPVVLFQHVAEPVGSYLETARRTIGAEVSTNQGSPRGHLYVFVFDENHISPGNEARARQAVDRFLHTRVKPGDRVALYALPGPGPQIPFTGNVALALAELPKVRGMLDRTGLTPIGDMTDYEAFQITRGNDQNPPAHSRPGEPDGRPGRGPGRDGHQCRRRRQGHQYDARCVVNGRSNGTIGRLHGRQPRRQ